MATIDGYSSGNIIEAEEYSQLKDKIMQEYERRQKGLGASSVSALSALVPSDPIQNNIIGQVNGANALNILELIISPSKAKQYAINNSIDYTSGDFIPQLASYFTIVNNLIEADESTPSGGCNAACTGLCVNTCAGQAYGESGIPGSWGCQNCGSGCASVCTGVSSCSGGEANPENPSMCNPCYGVCASACGGDCTKTCLDSCSGNCTGWCYSSCKDSCGTGCNGTAEGGCGTNCSGQCQFSSNF